MIKLTKISCNLNDAPSLILIPGGPGLSSLTLRSMDILSRSCNLLYVDFPGTNGNPYLFDNSFESLLDKLNSEILKLDGPIYLLGHSFGGFFAAGLSSRSKFDGVICISTPFTENTLKIAEENYDLKKTAALDNAEKNWEIKHDDKSFAEWLSEYGELYFTNPNGKELLRNDKVSAKFFIANRSELSDLESMLNSLAAQSTPKLFIAGQQDNMLPEEFLKSDALKGKFEFKSVKDAGHFVTFDQPELVASLIEDFMQQKT